MGLLLVLWGNVRQRFEMYSTLLFFTLHLMFQISRALHTNPCLRSYSTLKRFFPAQSPQHDGDNSVNNFNAQEPAVFKQSFNNIPAIEKWFLPSTPTTNSHELNLAYLSQYGDSIVPLELTRSTAQTSSFERFDAPLSLLLAHISGPETPDTRLYLAQHSLEDLPAPLQSDLPTPSLLSQLGRGDIYASSLWMGRPPTRTPLHRDPNPNLFVQLAGQKIVRLMRPDVGRGVYEQVRREVGREAGKANMRGQEMMEGREMELLEEAIWGENGGVEAEGVEAELHRGDGLYIPLGWWHAVRGVGSGANASVCICENLTIHLLTVLSGKLVVSLTTTPSSLCFQLSSHQPAIQAKNLGCGTHYVRVY